MVATLITIVTGLFRTFAPEAVFGVRYRLLSPTPKVSECQRRVTKGVQNLRIRSGKRSVAVLGASCTQLSTKVVDKDDEILFTFFSQREII
ncbi:MAG: hypothetical protein FWC38_08580 [Proteobacteria bacterium]|nr:hypothetical protein [Pseudomonadota bacterium]MCL2308256.1 hypothetical protein [Pseudomonadota bacterium]